MKKTLLIAVLTFVVGVSFAQNPDGTVTNNGVNGQYYEPAKNTAKSSSSTSVICKDFSRTVITVKGMAPYMTQPVNNFFWPRFSVSGSAGYVLKYFSVEGVLEYMQANVQPVGFITEYYNYILGSARFGGLLPIQLNNTVMLIPNVKGQLGGAFYFGSGFTSRFQAGVIGGLDLGFKAVGNVVITIGFAYDYRWFIDRSTTVGLGMMGGQLAVYF